MNFFSYYLQIIFTLQYIITGVFVIEILPLIAAI